MRILWVKVGGLWPPHTGGRLRSFHTLAELSRRHRVTLLTTHGPGDDPETLAARLPACEVASLPFSIPKRRSLRFARALLRSWGSSLPVDLLKFRVPALAAEVRRRLASGGFDLCIADFLSATVNVPAAAPVPVVLFAHNVEHRIWQRLAAVERRPWRRLPLEVEWRKMRRAEARAVRRAALTLAVSGVDRALFAALAPDARLASIATGVDLDFFAPRAVAGDPGALIFLGSMDWHPNEDAALWFLEDILPRIRRERPDASFRIVGRNPSATLRAAAAARDVLVTGTVEDVRPHLESAQVFVVPLRIGGGTRLKIIEALAMGKAVVSTSIGAEGLPLVPGTHYARADDPGAFAGAVLALLADRERRRALGTAGRRLVESRCSWSSVGEAFATACEGAIAAASRGRTEPGVTGTVRLIRRTLPAGMTRHLRAGLRLPPAARRVYWRLLFRRLRGAGLPDPGSGPRLPIRSVLCVCQGNIIRSPMAAALLRGALRRRGAPGVSVASAGLHAEPGRPADGRALRAAPDFGAPLDAHTARPLRADMVEGADVIFAMDSLIEAEILARHPDAGDRVLPLGVPGGGGRGRPVEIEDPFLGDERDIRRCYRLIRECVESRAEEIARRVLSPVSVGEERHAG